MKPKEDIVLDEARHRRECFLQSNQATIDFAKMLLRGTFLLNGASVTALLSTGNERFYSAALSFGWGAAWAVVSTMIVYAYQMLITETWRSEDGNVYLACFKGFAISWRQIAYLRIVPVIFVALSCIQFYQGASAVSALIK